MRLLCVSLAGVLSAIAQQASTGGWTALGPGAALRATSEGIAITYELRPKQISAAFQPASSSLARMQRMRFRVRTDYGTALAVALNEKMPGGGRYLAWFWSPANTWQSVELTPADFAAADGPQDPVDADGRLDLDAVESIAILDLAQFFGAAPENPDFPVVINRASGTHTFVLDDFQLLASAGPRAGAGRIDAFDRGFLQWVTLGGMDLKLSAQDNPLGMPALEATYQQTEGQFQLLMRRLANLDLSKATRLAFDIASEREATLVVALELKQGGRYNLTIYPPGSKELFHVDLKLADFEGAGKLDPAQLKSLAITDVTASTGGAPGRNTIWIGKVGTELR